VAGRDITEGDSNVWDLNPTDSLPIARGIADIGITSTSQYWQNTSDSYDVAVGGQPFFYAINDARPYIRQTAPYRKDQFDNGKEPGEQSLTGWWLRSQSSFHSGSGIKFYDPSAGEIVDYRFADSKGVNVWTKGQVTLLKDTATTHYTTGPIRTENGKGRPFQIARSIQYGTTNGILLWDEYDVDKIAEDGSVINFIDYASGSEYPVQAICDDGTYAYWIVNITASGTPRLRVYKKLLTGVSGAGDTLMITDNGITVTNAVMEYVKDRIVMCINNKIYEISSSASALPTAVYTHSDTDIVFSSITASGPAIYVAGYSGTQSSIFKFTLNTSGVMPTLTTAITAAEMPVGEIIHKIFYYLGYMMIGTNKGIRAAVVSDQDGSINYGPLIVETTQPCYDFAARDRFVWCATGVDGAPGVIRIDLGNEIETLRFAYANDLYVSSTSGYSTTTCAFAGTTDRLVFATTAINAGSISNKQRTTNVATLTTSAAHGLAVGDTIWVEGVDSTFNSTTTTYTVTAVPTTTTFTYTTATSGTVASTAVSPVGKVNKVGSINIEASATLVSTGYITSGYIRYGTLEPKNFKRLLARGDFNYGTLSLQTVDKDNNPPYDHITYESGISAVEVATSSPDTAQEYVAYKFVFGRDATTTSRGPVFKGYQAKATIATPRQRIMKFPVYCFDIETDRYNVVSGYEGKAFRRLQLLESVEENGDVVIWQDLTTGESRQVVIEQISFTRMTPPDKRFDGFGGVIEITVRTV
jgi:hypothetical protein